MNKSFTLDPILEEPDYSDPVWVRTGTRSASNTATLAEFDESKHPRADDGKFGSGGGGASPNDSAAKTGNISYFKDSYGVSYQKKGGEWSFLHPDLKDRKIIRSITIDRLNKESSSENSNAIVETKGSKDLNDPNQWQEMGEHENGQGKYLYGKHVDSGNHYVIEPDNGFFVVKRILPLEGAGKVASGTSLQDARKKANDHGEFYSNLKGAADLSLKKLGSKNELIISDVPYDFTLNNQSMTAGGSYNPQDGKITLYTAALAKHDRELGFLNGLLAHEFSHHKWKVTKDQYDKEQQAALDAGDMRASGEIKPEANGKYPAYESMFPLLNDHEKLRDQDGVSAYSKDWWNAYGNPAKEKEKFFSDGIFTPVNETLAEIHRQKIETGSHGGGEIYRKLDLAVSKQYLKLSK